MYFPHVVQFIGIRKAITRFGSTIVYRKVSTVPQNPAARRAEIG
jgi:hypothetical protein